MLKKQLGAYSEE